MSDDKFREDLDQLFKGGGGVHRAMRQISPEYWEKILPPRIQEGLAIHLQRPQEVVDFLKLGLAIDDYSDAIASYCEGLEAWFAERGLPNPRGEIATQKAPFGSTQYMVILEGMLRDLILANGEGS